MFTADKWKSYRLIDADGGERLEKWGDYTLIRPDPQIIWKCSGEAPEWRTAHAKYNRSSSGGGSWDYRRKLPESWQIKYGELTFMVKPTGFKHTGLFPEQAVNWDYCMNAIRGADRPINVLNLFAYTGGATLACAAAGASVCHVDAVKGMVDWARTNAKLSGLSDKPIRWIVDDAQKFISREIRRGNHYDGIILDPPSYGRGTNGEMWKLEDCIYDLMESCTQLLSDKPLFVTVGNHETLELKCNELVRYHCDHLHQHGMVLADYSKLFYEGEVNGCHVIVLAQDSDTYTVTGYKGMWIHAGEIKPEQIDYLLRLAAQLKAEKKAGIPHRLCEGKNVALIFEKTSTRTRSSFEVAAHDLGMGSTYLDSTGSQIGKKESIADTARVLSGMFDGIEYRGYGQSIVEELAQYASVPVWNGLTDEFHPTQILADFLTIREHFGSLENIHLVYMGDARFNMGNSLMVGCVKMGMHFTACAPEGYFPDAQLVAECQAIAAQTGATLDFISDPAAAVQGANVIYTDIWVSMGEPESVWAERIAALAPYQVNAALMAKAGPNAIFMHCLPAYHDKKTAVGSEMCTRFGREAMEVTDDVFESAQSVVFQEAENRMHTIKAVMAATLAEIEL